MILCSALTCFISFMSFYVPIFPAFLFLLDSLNSLDFSLLKIILHQLYTSVSLTSSLYNETAWKSLPYLILYLFFSFVLLSSLVWFLGIGYTIHFKALKKYISALSVIEVINSAFNIVNHFLHLEIFSPLHLWSYIHLVFSSLIACSLPLLAYPTLLFLYLQGLLQTLAYVLFIFLTLAWLTSHLFSHGYSLTLTAPRFNPWYQICH